MEPFPPSEPQEPHVFGVGELNRTIKQLLDRSFEQSVWVEGEVIGVKAAMSGHLYFCIKDEQEDASIDVAIYKLSLNPSIRALIKDGTRVRLRGRPSFWPLRGRLQFVAERAELAGRGALLEALEKLKARLTEEGLFAAERKRPLPSEPRVIGVVTSAGGAVIHDICKVAFRRGGAHILLAPALVQGAGVAVSIRQALTLLQKVPEVDVIIVGRGGGSADDLSPFNDEDLVRAVAACRVPVVSAVGHEIDITLTDFAADIRAATPSQAAEIIVPDAVERVTWLKQTKVRLCRAVQASVLGRQAKLHMLIQRMGDPRLTIASFQQSLDDKTNRLETVTTKGFSQKREQLNRMSHRLMTFHPTAVIARDRARLVQKRDQLVSCSNARLLQDRTAIHTFAARLHAMSPLNVLARGYAIVTQSHGRVVRAADEVQKEEKITIRLSRGYLDAQITDQRETEEL
ncbi:exodeoxyribonuclease VII large subunit [Pajaroellobacter abortibovis]|uniref:Exodeoxyribonuclease 7 large subunit n=1 Tax=Pajaroellobacter abortibovis TaxID=1882918 RepID=A0A1L6N033_9BACT|nr:exodeoxyribonuclease VII large subunit [Pajaroellobacter abortibovis]